MPTDINRAEEVRAIRLTRERVAELLSRYPRMARHEVDEVIEFLRNGRHLEIGLLTSNDRIRPQLDAFMAEHKAHFRVRWLEGATVVAAIAAILAMLWFAWESLA
jgi:hypothetical protein